MPKMICARCGEEFPGELEFEIHDCPNEEDVSKLSNEELIKRIEATS